MKHEKISKKFFVSQKSRSDFLGCPKCKSNNVNMVNYLSVKCIKCNNCGFDETMQYNVYPEEKTSQKEKGRYTPYKSGGPKRAR